MLIWSILKGVICIFPDEPFEHRRSFHIPIWKSNETRLQISKSLSNIDTITIGSIFWKVDGKQAIRLNSKSPLEAVGNCTRKMLWVDEGGDETEIDEETLDWTSAGAFDTSTVEVSKLRWVIPSMNPTFNMFISWWSIEKTCHIVLMLNIYAVEGSICKTRWYSWTVRKCKFHLH